MAPLPLPSRGRLLLGLLTLACLGWLAAAFWLRQRPVESPEEPFRPERHMLPLDPVFAEDIRPATEAMLEPSELVLGVEVGGEARAYPVNLLNADRAHKVVNDRLGGHHIAAVW